MTPQDIVDTLEGRGWTAEIVSESDVNDIVDVNNSGLFKCVDGRPSDHAGMSGPKALGGIYAIASVRGATDLADLGAIVDEVKAQGHVPSVHGDGHASAMGCGYFKLWLQGDLGLTPPNFTAEEGKQAVIDAGGVYENLEGDHEEKVVMINLVENKTFQPKGDDQRFVVDAWIAAKFKLDVGTYLTLGATTVEKLNGPKIAKIVVPVA